MSLRRLAPYGLAAVWILSGCGDGGDPATVEPADAILADAMPADAHAAETAQPEPAPADTESTEPLVEDTFVPDTTPPAPVAVAVVTQAPEFVRAGDAFVVSCLLQDAHGNGVTPPADAQPKIASAPTDTVLTEEDGLVATQVGQIHVHCQYPGLYLTDTVGATITVEAGPAAFVATDIDRTTVTAGDEPVAASCSVFDEYGNPLPKSPLTVQVRPDTGQVVDDDGVHFTVAGTYDVFCDVPGAENSPQQVVVVPNLPASLAIARTPTDPVVPTGTVVRIHTTVADRFGNLIEDAPIWYSSSPNPADRLGPSRFLFDEDGTYVITVRVNTQTDADVDLTDTLSVEVNGSGPSIGCQSGRMKNVSLTRDYTFTGSVSDASGVASLKVNGQSVNVSDSGGFSAPIDPRFGMNFVEVVATDTFGEETSRLCTLLLSDHYKGATSYIKESVMVRLEDEAIDDGNRSGADNSLADVVDTVIDSNAFENTMEDMVRGQGTSGSQCIGIPTPWGCGGWNATWDIRVDRLTINGNNSVAITLLSDNRIRIATTFRDVNVRIRITGSLNTTVTARVSSLNLTMTGRVTLSGGKMNFHVISGPSASVNATLDTALPNWIDSIINAFVQNRVENEVEKAVENAAEDAIEPLLDGVLGNLDVGDLVGGFWVPKIAGGSVRLNVDLRMDTLSITSSRLLSGLGTRVTSPSNVVSAPTLGVPIPTSSAYTSATGSGSARVAAYVGILNQALHALWKGGFMDGNVGNALGDALPAGASVALQSSLPPVARLRSNGQIELGLGGLRLTVIIPGLFEGSDALVAEVGALLRATPTLSGSTLSFGTLNLTEFFFTSDVANLDSATRETLEDLFTTLMRDIAETALNDGLPSLPIPSFDIPSNNFGLTGSFSLVQPALGRKTHHFILSGNMRRQ